MRTVFEAQLAATAIALVFLAVFLRSAALLIVVLIPVTLFAFGATAPPQVPRLVVARTLSRDRMSIGQEVQVSVRVRNDGPALDLVELWDPVPPELTITEGSNRRLLAIPRDGELVVEYVATARGKGETAVGPLQVRSLDPLGLGYETSDARDAATLLIAPPIEDLRQVRVAPRRTRPWFGPVPSRTIGHGTEFYGIRGYVPGDETRRVNWKASARHDRLLVNEYEGERTSDAVIVLDARTATEVGPPLATTADWGVRAALSVAAALLSAGNRVGLLVQRNLLDWVYLGYGRKQLHRILEVLIRTRTGGDWRLEHVAATLPRLFPRKVHVILISPLVDAPAVAALADLVARGFDMTVISPSPVEVERRMYPAEPALDDAYRLLRLERSNVISALRRYAAVVDWDPAVPLALALKGVERFPGRR